MSTKNATLYDTDFYAWANEQAALLRAGRFSDVDVGNVAEEIESMGQSEKRELVSRLSVLSLHLLQWRLQPTVRGKSRRDTIDEQQSQVVDHLNEKPGLQGRSDEIVETAYRTGRVHAARETGLDKETFPLICPFSVDEAVNPDFWPD